MVEDFPADDLKVNGRFFIFAPADDDLNQKAELEAGKEIILSQFALRFQNNLPNHSIVSYSGLSTY